MCYFYYHVLPCLICFGLKRERIINRVTPAQIQLQSSSSGTHSVFPSKSLTACSEQVGHFNFTYAIFRHVFAQMGAYLQLLSFL